MVDLNLLKPRRKDYVRQLERKVAEMEEKVTELQSMIKNDRPKRWSEGLVDWTHFGVHAVGMLTILILTVIQLAKIIISIP